jgi:hypothetical protein
MGHPVALVLAVLVGLATAYCLARCVVPRWRAEHGPAVDAWHVAMGTAMVAMLVAPVGRNSAAVQAAAFGLAALWCACHLLARNRSAVHARLGGASAVMAVMLMPVVIAAPASAAPSTTVMPEHHHTPGIDMSGMAGTELPGVPAGMAMPPGWLAVLMLVAVAAIAVAAARAALATPGRGAAHRLSLACEVVMAGAMGYMAALTLLP